MSEETSTVLCLWCRRVIEWGAGPIAWDLCSRCVPSVMEALEARMSGGSAVRRSPTWRARPEPGLAASGGGAALPAW